MSADTAETEEASKRMADGDPETRSQGEPAGTPATEVGDSGNERVAEPQEESSSTTAQGMH